MKIAFSSPAPEHHRPLFPRILLLCAPLPALILGVTAMRRADVATVAWLTNVAATIAGLLLVAFVRPATRPARPATQLTIAIAAVVAILLPFASLGVLGVHRWVRLGTFALQPSAIVAPLLIASMAAIMRRRSISAIAIAVIATGILALQPDAAQATSLAAACSTLLAFDLKHRRPQVIGGIVLLFVAAIMSIVQRDPLPPVAHVEEIYGLVASGGIVWAMLGAAALVLLPIPFVALFNRNRDRLPLALAVYVAMTVLAPFWGTFPVPVMGYGVSHVLGYFIALALCSRASATGALPST